MAFDDNILRSAGAKRAVLEYIQNSNPHIPIPRFLDKPNDDPGVILRSDHWREFDSFYGIFESVKMGQPFVFNDGMDTDVIPCLEEALSIIKLRSTGNKILDETISRKRRLFDYYCHAKGLDPGEVLDEVQVLPQELINAEIYGYIFQHPNLENRYFIHISGERSPNDATFHVEIYGKTLKVRDSIVRGSYYPPEAIFDTGFISYDGLEQIIEMFESVLNLPNFHDGYAYIMEFSLNPDYVFQVRRFRKYEQGGLYDCDWKEEKGVFWTDMCIGITPKEGVVMPFALGRVFYPYLGLYNDNLQEFNRSHPGGFACKTAGGKYVNTFFPNVRAILAGDISKFVHHGNLETLSTVPVTLFEIGRLLRGINRHGQTAIELKDHSLIKIFSNGDMGYVKVIE